MNVSLSHQFLFVEWETVWLFQTTTYVRVVSHGDDFTFAVTGTTFKVRGVPGSARYGTSSVHH